VHLILEQKRALEKELSNAGKRFHGVVAQIELRVGKFQENIRKLNALKKQLHDAFVSGVSKSWPMAEQERMRTEMEKLLKNDDIVLVSEIRSAVDLQSLAVAEEKIGKLIQRLLQGSSLLAQEAEATHYRVVASKFAREQTATTPLAKTLRNLEKKNTSLLQATSEMISLEQVGKMLADLALLHDHAGWTSIEKRARAILQEQDADLQRLHYNSLLIEGSSLLKQLRNTDRWKKELGELIDSFAHLQGNRAQVMRCELGDMLRKGVANDLGPHKAQVAAMIKADEQAAEREEKRRAFVHSLKALGYEPIEGKMETAFVELGKLYIRKPGEEEYAVEVVADEKMSLLQTELVRFTGGGSSDGGLQQKLRDKEREETWCADHARIIEEMKRCGMQSEFKMKNPAGQIEVKTIARSKTSWAKDTMTGRMQQRVRNLQ